MFRIKGIVKKVLLMIGVEMLEIDRWNMRYGWLSLFGLLRVIKVWMKDCRRVWEWNFNSNKWRDKRRDKRKNRKRGSEDK